MIKTMQTSLGVLDYDLTRKKVKNINVRIKPGGNVCVSAPNKVSIHEIETFMQQKAEWIFKHKRELGKYTELPPCRVSREECLEIFTQISDQIFPLFADLLNHQKPRIRVREMKTRWGVCHPEKRVITLNTRLAEKPEIAIEYVVLHEYVHFLHRNHQKGFHDEMARLMPDYKIRRRLLRNDP